MQWQPTHLTREQLEERRLAGAKLLKAGTLSKVEIARYLGVSRTTVYTWAQKLRTGGIRRLNRRLSNGRPSKLSRAQQDLLKRHLKRGTLAAGFPTDRWTLHRVKKLIQTQFDVEYHPHYLSRLLHDLGFSVQKPIDRALERDDALVEAWLKRDWPRIKKSTSARY